jgi:PAS domain S-box-containing protein
MQTPEHREAAAQQKLTDAIARLHSEPTTSESRFREVFDHAFGFIGLLAGDGTVLDANRTSLEATGLSRADVIGRPIWDAPCWPAAGDVRERLRDAVAAARSGALVRYETELEAGGEVRTVDLSLKPLTDAAGQVVLIIPEARDMTARRRSEGALRESEERFHRIVAIAADAIISIDEGQRITLFNQGAEKIFGWAANEVMGQPLGILLPEDLVDVHGREVRGFAASPTVARRMGDRRAIFGRRRDGEIFPAEASISKTSVGGQPMFTAVVRDISERRAQEEERDRLLAVAEAARAKAQDAWGRVAYLAEVGDVLSASLDFDQTIGALGHLVVPKLAAFCLIDLVDGQGRVHRVDALHARVEMQHVLDVLRRYPRDDSTKYLSKQALDTGRAQLRAHLTDDDLRAIACDEAHLRALVALAPRSCICAPLRARGHTLGALTLLRDAETDPYTELELSFVEEVAHRAALAVDNARLYHQAQDAARQRDLVLGVVSHDLRNPLSVIGMCAKALTRESDAGGQDRAHLAQTIQGSVEWMQRLMGDLVDISSIEAGRLSFDPEPVDPIVIAAKAADLFERVAAEKAILLELEVPERVRPAHADEQRILQVLGNLIGNAVKFTEPGGRITIGISETADGIVFSVSDTGVGIAAEDVPSVFDRFWHRAASGIPRGTGLGLAIAKGIVQAHGGTIWVETGSERGSVFRFTLPELSTLRGNPLREMGSFAPQEERLPVR